VSKEILAMGEKGRKARKWWFFSPPVNKIGTKSGLNLW
jgi:hypothetical protein